jgi:alpha-N-acetylglucosaminidase
VSRVVDLNRRHLILGTAVLPAAAAARGHDDPAQAVLTRLIGRRSEAFRLEVASGGAPSYVYTARRGQVAVKASSQVAALYGAYAYLKDNGLAHASWDGNRAELPHRLPDGQSGRVESAFPHRLYLNTCTFGYTTPFWDWPRWRREIDWMALHGIDMPLAMEGQEWVWRALWQEEGLNDAELDAYFSGPAFAPWQRMGNIEGYDAPLPLTWMARKRDLQKRILGAMRELGMEPILPAFAGYVPKAFADKHPQARIYRMRAWEGFHETYWLDPADPLFDRLAGRFLDLYDLTYGKGRYYLADAFNEMLPPIGDGPAVGGKYGDGAANKAAAMAVDPAVKAQKLAAYGRALHDSIRRARPDATWVMQGWLFGADQAFWTADAIAAFLRDVPDDGLMVLDIGNDRYPDVHRTARSFGGKAWTYGYVHNYGGSNPVYGDLGFYADDVARIAADPGKGNLAGFGVFPEGLDSNSVVYDYLYDRPWTQTGTKPEPLPDWLTGYTRARYGKTSQALVAAWVAVVHGAYRTRYWTPRWWHDTAGAYLLCKRPDIGMAGYESAPGDRQALRKGVTQLSALSPEFAASPLFGVDLVDFTRHLASLHLDDLIRATLKAYQARDPATGDAGAAEVTRLTLVLDDLMGLSPHHLAGWIGEARAYGATPAEADDYERNARAQITVWGGDGNLHDYASKAWQGLYRDFYLPRWTMMFDALRVSPFDAAATRARLIAWERNWANTIAPVARRVPSRPFDIIAELLATLPPETA